MSELLDGVAAKFGEAKRVGASGEHMAYELGALVTNIDHITFDFEEGLKSPAWVENFRAVGGDELLVWAEAVYKDLLIMKATLQGHGL